MGLMFTFGATAQWEQPFNPTVPQSDIQFWTGSGSNRAVIAITWSDATAGNIGLAWGVQWNGNNVILRDLMDTIATYDSRMAITWNSENRTYINNLSYTDAELGLNLIGEVDPDYGMAWFMYGWKDANNVVKQSNGIMGDTIASGDFIDWNLMDMETYETLLADTMIMATNPNATPVPQVEEATIDFSEILYWVGEGENEVVLAINWADTALAWGYKFNGTKSVSDMMNDIAATDPRFSIEMGEYGLADIVFVAAPGDTLRKQAYSYWESKNNNEYDAGMGQALANGDFEKWAEPAAGIVVDSTYWADYSYWSYSYVYTMDIVPVSMPQEDLPEEATIAAEDILYWVGEGSNQAVLAVNWADAAFAWGYKFNGTKSVSDMMNDIAAADPRFSIEMGEYGLADIVFVAAPGDTLRKQAYSYWESKNNNEYDAGMGQALANGDFEKWAEPAAGIVVDSTYWADYSYWSYSYVYTMDIVPVSVPQTEGIDNTESVSLSVYPNPTTNMVTVSGIEGSSTAMLFDMRGSLVATFAINGVTRLDLSRISNGVYMLHVADSVVKIIKE